MANFNLEDYPEVEPKFNLEDYPEIPIASGKQSPLMTGIESIGQGLTGGFLDEIQGGLELGGTALGVKGLGGPVKDIELADEGPTLDWEVLSSAYKKRRDAERERMKKGAKESPVIAGAGNVLGSIVSPINKIGKGLSLAKQGAIAGGIYGAGESEAENVADLLKDAGTGMVVGGTLSKGVDVASPYIGKGLKYASDKASDIAERLAARTLGAERGTIKKLGQEKVQELGRYALDEGLLSPFASTDDVIARNAAKQAQGGKMMGEAYSAIDDTGKAYFNPLEAATKVEGKIGDFYRSPINRGETNQLENTLESILMRGEKNIPLKEAQKLKEELGKVANWRNKVTVTDKEQMARDAYGVITSQIDEAVNAGMKDIGSDSLLNTLQQGKKLYGASKGAEELLENKLAREQGNKLIGLTDWGVLGAGGAALPITGGASLPATALLYGGKKYAEKYGTQQGALLADKVSKQLLKSPNMQKLLSENPAAFQAMVQKMLPKQEEQQKPKYDNDAVMQKIKGTKYEQVLNNAKQNGDQSAAAAHYVLSNQDAEYRKLLEDEGE